ncbi:MAG: hypothetical protein IJX99_07675 [Clostridia bacterium]|nr:hypothetical protein [Clostridia bacterium]
MKVLFAVGTDQLSKNIADKYYEKYGEVLEYKNVFFFKALIEEVKNNKTYDRIVINEDLEEYRSKDLDQIDRMIFNYIDRITDETQDAEIILICTNRRSKGDPFISKLFSIGIYNLLIGDDRNMNPLCEIIKKPKNKREAKQYLNIDTSLITEDSITRDNEVDEYQVKSILSFYEGIRNQPEKFLETFDRVAEQYSRVQLKIIVEYLPKAVKDEIFKADRYKYLAPQVDVSQVNVVNQSNASKAPNVQKEQPKKKGGLFGGFKKHKADPAQNVGKIDMSEMQSSGKVDLSSNIEEQKRANIQAEAKRMAEENRAKEQAELEARARAEAAARAEAEAKARRQAELDAKARERAAAAEAEARKQEELANKARAEIEARKQAELEARARAEAEARRRQAEQEAKVKAEAVAREQAMLAAKAKAEAEARTNAGFVPKANNAVNVPNAAPGTLMEIKPNPNAPDRKEQKNSIPVATVIPKQEKKDDIVINNNVNPKPQVKIEPNIQVNPVPQKAVEQKVEVNQVSPKMVEQKVEANPVQPKINVTTNSGVVPTGVTTHEIERNVPNTNFVQTPSTNQVVNNVSSSVISEQERRMKEEQEKLALEQKKIREAQEKLEEEKRKLREEQEKLVSAQTQLRNEYTKTATQHYTNNEVPVQTSPLPNYKKMVVFVGANKVGTTFVTNAVAHTIASSKVVTSVIDMTRDKSLYYIYADESKALKNRAAECMQRLADGEDYYIETMNSNLKLYTTVAGSVSDQRRGYKHKAIIETVKSNCNLTIVDADFTTPIDYFDQADEIYLIQDLDILKIQDVTLFLRELNARGLDKKKIKLIINKFVKTSITPKIIIGALDFYHDPGGTYVDSGLMPSKVDYSLIPYNLNNYAKYVESLHKMTGNFNYKNYSTDFVQAIEEIVGKVYPKNAMMKTKKFFG